MPVGHSALLQLLISALYSELLKQGQENKFVAIPSDNISCKNDTKLVANGCDKQNSTSNVENELLEYRNSIVSINGATNSEGSIALALAEALCSIDEDNKHTEQIEQFLDDVKANLHDVSGRAKYAEHSFQALEIIASDLLSTSYGKKSLKVS